MRLLDMFYRLLDGERAVEPLLLDGQFEIPYHHRPKELAVKIADQEIIIALFNDLYSRVANLEGAVNSHVSGAVSLADVNSAIAEALAAEPTLDPTKVSGYVPPVAASDPAPAA